MNNTKTVKTVRVVKNANKNRKKKNKSKKKNSSKSRVTAIAPMLSHCAKIYLRAQTNPFGNFGNKLPCIPDALPFPSHKIKVTLRGTCFNGTANNTGFVIYNPWLMIANDGSNAGAVSTFPIIWTDKTYAGSAATYQCNVAAGAFTVVGVNGQNSNSPYTSATLTSNNWDFRLVSAGLRARYIGDDFHNSGRFILFRDQANGTIGVSTAFATMQNDTYTQTVPVKDRQWVYVTAPPASYSLLSYQPFVNFNNITFSASTLNHYCMIIGLDGMDSSGQQVEFEAVAFFEIVGRNLDTTPSESDPDGYAAATSAISSMIRAPTKSPEVVEQTILKTASDYLLTGMSNAAPHLINYGGKLLGSAARAYFGGPSFPSISQGPTITEL